MQKKETKQVKSSEVNTEHKEMSFKQGIVSSEFVLQCWWYSVNLLQSVFFVGSLNAWLTDIIQGDMVEGEAHFSISLVNSMVEKADITTIQIMSVMKTIGE